MVIDPICAPPEYSSSELIYHILNELTLINKNIVPNQSIDGPLTLNNYSIFILLK